jgi:hypothetical protein
MRRLCAVVVLALALAGCVAVSEDLTSLGDVSADDVVLVGKIEIVPRVKPQEQSFKAADPFNTRRYYIGRAILFMSDEPEYQDRTDTALNPELEHTYFLRVAKAKRYMVKGSVTMAFALRSVSRRQAVAEQTELMLPSPVEFDIRPGDRAIYVGTLRVHRDEFHEVTKAEVRDEYAKALAEYKARFPGAPPLRKALMRRARVS